MNFAELCRLITVRSPRLRPLREQVANGNEQTISLFSEKKKLFIAAIKHLLQNEATQQCAVEQITMFMISASPQIVKAVTDEIISGMGQFKNKKLGQHKQFWSKIYDGSVDRKEYPNIKAIINYKTDQIDRVSWSAQFKQYLLQFQKNFNQRRNDRVEFFDDDQDSFVSDSFEQDNQQNKIYLSLYEMKAIRNKLQDQKLSEAELDQQLIKIKYFLSLKVPTFMPQDEWRTLEKQRQWAADFIANAQRNTLSNNKNQQQQNFNLSGVEQQIQIVDRSQFNMKRTLKEAVSNKSRQNFKDSQGIGSQKVNNNMNINELITPVKLLPEHSKDAGERLSSKNSSVAVFNQNYSNKFKAEYLRVEQRQLQDEELPVENIVVHKYKGGNLIPTEDKKYATHYGFGQVIPSLQINSAPFQSQTANSWKKNHYFSPSKNSRCKLSEFTSEKKKRKQLAPKSKLSFPEEFYITPYLCYFKSNFDFCRFRRNCFESNFILYSGAEITVSCLLNKDVNCRIQLEMLYMNQADTPLEVESVYKIPKCFQVKKSSKISKRFQLHNNLKHTFSLQVQEFPLDPCILNMKYRAVESGVEGEAHIPLPLTILNFIEYIHFSEEEWIRQWNYLGEKNRQDIFHLVKHIEADRQIVGEELEWILRQGFAKVGFCEGYSIQDYGCWCRTPAISGLKFMVRLSLRVDSIVSLELKSTGSTNNYDNEFMEYCLNMWMMLLSKLHFQRN